MEEPKNAGPEPRLPGFILVSPYVGVIRENTSSSLSPIFSSVKWAQQVFKSCSKINMRYSTQDLTCRKYTINISFDYCLLYRCPDLEIPLNVEKEFNVETAVSL